MAVADIFIRIVTKGADLAKQQMSGLGKSADGTTGKLGKLSGMMKAGVAVGLVAIGKGLTEAVQQFIGFDDAMTQSLAIMNTTVEQQKRMEESALAVSRTSRITAEQSAEAFFFLASAGLDAEQSIQALPQVAKFAQAGMFDMATATDLATDAQSALGLASDDALQNLENLTRTTDVLVKANTLANASVQQFSEALTNKAGSALKVTNKSIEEGVAVLSALADRGVKGAEAGEKLNQILRDIPRATAKNSEEFAKLGLNMFDTEGNMKNVADIVEELDRVLGPMSDELKASTLDQLGLNRGVADAVKILSGAGDEIRAYESALLQSGGTTEDVANKQMGSLKAQLDLMNNAFTELGILIGDIIAPALTSLVEKITKIIHKTTGLVTKTRELNKEMKENMEAVEGQSGLYGTELPKAYNIYGSAIKETTEDLKDSRTATQRAIDMGTKYSNMNSGRLATDQIIHDAMKEHTRTITEQTEALEELTEEELKKAKALKDKALPALNKVMGAYNKLVDIQKEQEDLLKDVGDAEEDVTEAQKDLTKAQDKARIAEEKMIKAKEQAEKVTLQEKLAIEQLKHRISELEQEEEKTRITELQLAIAKEKLIELEEAKTGATNESIRAEEEYKRALDNVKKAEEDLTKAQNLLTEAQKEFNEATAQTPENLLEIAIAQKELQDAIANVESLGIFEEALSQMVANAGGELSTLQAFFESLFSGQNIPSFSGGGGFTPSGNGEKTNESSESGDDDTKEIVSDSVAEELARQKILADSRFAGGTTSSSGVTTILNLQNEFNITNNDPDATAEAIIRAQKNGIKVIL
jgi:TP901 family phage tail tape measure protein